MGSHQAFQWETIKKIYRVWADYPDTGGFQGDLRKQGLIPDWMQSGSSRSSMIGYTNLI